MQIRQLVVYLITLSHQATCMSSYIVRMKVENQQMTERYILIG